MHAEAKLWRVLHARQFDAKFRRQVPIGPYFADFLSYDLRLVIEVDGGQHADSDRDVRRDAWFESNGYRLLRFWNNDVLSNIEGVAEVIRLTIGARRAAKAAR
jgi:very-short-patch-repair endonuclease